MRQILTSACPSSLRLDLSVRGGALRNVAALIDSIPHSNIVEGKRNRKQTSLFITSKEGEQHSRKPRTGASFFVPLFEIPHFLTRQLCVRCMCLPVPNSVVKNPIESVLSVPASRSAGTATSRDRQPTGRVPAGTRFV